MRLFLDECVSPRIAATLNAEGSHLVEHPRDFGGLGQPDHRVLARCLDRDMVIVTHNARDFRALLGTADIHPGLIILPALDRSRSEGLLRAAIAHLASLGDDPMDAMVNHVLEVSANAHVRLALLAAR